MTMVKYELNIFLKVKLILKRTYNESIDTYSRHITIQVCVDMENERGIRSYEVALSNFSVV